MRNIIIVLLLSVFLQSCTIYKIAADERPVKTIASDFKIRAALSTDIIQNDELSLFDIDTGVYEGNVVIVGQYNKESDRQEAVRLARSIKGVKSVQTYLVKKVDDDMCSKTVDFEVKATIKANFYNNRHVRAVNVKVDSYRCHVVLFGMVGSMREKQIAEEIAKKTKWVREVKNLLVISSY